MMLPIIWPISFVYEICADSCYKLYILNDVVYCNIINIPTFIKLKFLLMTFLAFIKNLEAKITFHKLLILKNHTL